MKKSNICYILAICKKLSQVFQIPYIFNTPDEYLRSVLAHFKNEEIVSDGLSKSHVILLGSVQLKFDPKLFRLKFMHFLSYGLFTTVMNTWDFASLNSRGQSVWSLFISYLKTKVSRRRSPLKLCIPNEKEGSKSVPSSLGGGGRGRQ